MEFEDGVFVEAIDADIEPAGDYHAFCCSARIMLGSSDGHPPRRD